MIRQELISMLQSLVDIPVNLKEETNLVVLIDCLRVKFANIELTVDQDISMGTSITCSERVYK